MKWALAILCLVLGLACWLSVVLSCDGISKSKEIAMRVILMLIGAGALTYGVGTMLRLLGY